MEYGFNLPTRGPLADEQSLRLIAARGEALGYGYLSVPDHIVIPRAIGSRYPYSRDGAYPGGDSGDCLEQLTVLAFLAAVTSRARLVTSVMVVPHRNPVHTAKILATIDHLSRGRLVVGCGAGWMQEEFEAIGTPPFRERGRVTDEYLRVFKELWAADSPEFHGAYADFSNIAFAPKPTQKPHPPLWIGGESEPAMRRAVRHGETWFPIGSNPRHPLNTPGRYAAGVARLRQIAGEEGRDPDGIGLAFWANWYREGRRIELEEGGRHLFSGSAREVAGDIRALRDLGTRQLLFNFQRSSLDDTLASMERFMAEVVPLVG